MAASNTLKWVIEVDETGAVKSINKFEKQVKDTNNKIDKSFDHLSSKSMKSANAVFSHWKTTFGAIAAFVAGSAITKSLLSTSMQFEKFETQLKTITGSSENAKVAMDWIEDFAQKTPYQLSEVTDAFIRLSSYGIDATKELKKLGDTASAMGKPLMQAIEMFADAASSQFERLREFGIKTEQSSDKVTFKYTENGKEIQKTVENNATSITNALSEIFSKFDGAMNDQSKTLEGMWSNLIAAYNKLEKKVMDAGIYDEIKKGVGSVTVALEKWIEDNEELIKQKIPEYIDGMKIAFNNMKEMFKLMYPILEGILTHMNNVITAMREIISLAQDFSWEKLFYGPGGKAGWTATQQANAFGWRPDPDSARAMGMSDADKRAAAILAPPPKKVNPVPGGGSKGGGSGKSDAQRLIEQRADLELETLIRTNELMGNERQAEIIKVTKDYEKKFAMAEKGSQLYLQLTENFKLEIANINKKYDKEEADKQDEIEKEKTDKLKEEWEERVRISEEYTDMMMEAQMVKWEQEQAILDQESAKWEAVGGVIGDAFLNTYEEIMAGNLSLIDSFKNLAANILRDLSRMIMKMLVTKAIMAAIGFIMPGSNAHAFNPTGGATGILGTGDLLSNEFAKGGVFAGGNVIPFASGGIVTRPTIFPMAKGDIGLMGEAGPEAIMPLKRGRNGKLGVEGGGGINMTNNIVIENGGQMAEDPEKMNKFVTKIGEEIRNQVRAVMVDEQRVNGIFNSPAIRRYA